MHACACACDGGEGVASWHQTAFVPGKQDGEQLEVLVPGGLNSYSIISTSNGSFFPRVSGHHQ